MAKMYYNEQEAAQKLNVGNDELLDMVRNGDLRAYADGANRMFKVSEVDQLAAANQPADSNESDIQLSPVEMSGTHAPVSLSDTEDTTLGLSSDTGSDTVLTSEGISIFDDEELEDLDIEQADPMAKTQIAPSLEEGIGIESPSSGGSGLLDLTRETDDTSLGEDVLGHIDMESGEMPSVESGEGLTEQAEQAAPAMIDAGSVAYYEPASGLYAGIALAAFLVAMLCAILAMGVMTGVATPVSALLSSKIAIYAGAAVVVLILCAVIGKFAGGKAAA